MTWRSLISSQKRICGEINRRRSLALVLFCRFVYSLLSFCVSLFSILSFFYSLLSFCISVSSLSSKCNKRATWRSLICAK